MFHVGRSMLRCNIEIVIEIQVENNRFGKDKGLNETTLKVFAIFRLQRIDHQKVRDKNRNSSEYIESVDSRTLIEC